MEFTTIEKKKKRKGDQPPFENKQSTVHASNMEKKMATDELPC